MDKVYSLLGLSKKAGKLVSGDETCERAIKSGKAVLVIVSKDASENTRDKFESMCKYREVCFRQYGVKQNLGRCIGKDIRSVVAIISDDFKNGLLKLIDQQNQSGGEGIG